MTERTPVEPQVDRAPEIRARLERLELERLEILADEGVPGRKHRLDAIAGASEDLRAELARINTGPCAADPRDIGHGGEAHPVRSTVTPSRPDT